MSQRVETGTPILLSSSGVVSLASGTLLGFYVASTSSGTIVVRNGGSGGTAVSGTITPAAGAFYRFPAYCPDGCYLTIANTISVTAFFQAG